MILIIDYRNKQCKLLLADHDGARIFDGGRNEGFVQLEKVIEEMASLGQPTGVAVVLPAADDADPANHLSWSTVRAAVSMANSLAFAWGVPAVRVAAVVDDELVQAAEEAVAEGDASSRVSAFYDGEPNITKPKK